MEWDESQCRYDYGLWLLGENLGDHNLGWTEARLAGSLHDWVTREANPPSAEALDVNLEAENLIYTVCLAKLTSG